MEVIFINGGGVDSSIKRNNFEFGYKPHPTTSDVQESCEMQ